MELTGVRSLPDAIKREHNRAQELCADTGRVCRGCQMLALVTGVIENTSPGLPVRRAAGVTFQPNAAETTCRYRP